MKKFFTTAIVALSALVFSGDIAIMAASHDSSAETAAMVQKKKKTKETKVLKLSANIHCENCAKKVRENIGFEKGVKGLEVSVADRTVTITYDPAKTDVVTLLAAMRKIGYPATIIE